MTRDEIIRMAREAGGDDWGIFRDFMPELERFANLVAAAEREELAQWMIQRSYATGHGDTTEDLLKELEWQIAERCRELESIAIEIEREQCAKVCESVKPFGLQLALQKATIEDCAAAIRERGAP